MVYNNSIVHAVFNQSKNIISNCHLILISVIRIERVIFMSPIPSILCASVGNDIGFCQRIPEVTSEPILTILIKISFNNGSIL